MDTTTTPNTGGYIRADILGRERGLKFGTLAAENIMVKLTALGIATGGSYSSAMISVIIYWGLFNNCIAKEEDPDFTFEQVMDWTDEMTDEPNVEVSELLTRIVRTYEESKAARSILLKLEKTVDGLKKKARELRDQISEPGKDGSTSEASPSGSSA
jgi:hypothetical protein